MMRLRYVAVGVTTLVLVAGGFAVTKMIARPGAGAAECRVSTGDARRACYTKLLSERLTKRGVADAVATLEAMAAADPEVATQAHEYAHGLGIEAYGKSTDIVATFAACGDGFASGCRHGVIQAYFESRHQVTQSEVEGLCQPFKRAGQSRWVLFQCVHGMGHGLTMFHGYDLPRALTDCDLLLNTWDRDSCYGGVFMESIINATTPHHPASRLAAQGHHHEAATKFKAIEPKDPLYPCSIMADRHQFACYQMQTSIMLHLNRGDIGHAARSCERAPAKMRSVCFQSLGRDATSYSMRDPQKTVDLCHKARDPYRAACYFGAAKALVDWTATTEAAFAFCQIVANEPGAPTCYQALGEEIATLHATQPERDQQCIKAKDEWAVEACRHGAGISSAR
jgi:hypothetical protein